MNIDVALSAAQIAPEQVRGRTACVIDVFRATSVMVTALQNGVRRIIPVLTPEAAFAWRDAHATSGETILLGGERDTVLIPGFDLDNSPLAYTPERVGGATLVFTTTNGTRAVKGSAPAARILIGALTNATAVCKRMAVVGDDVLLVCSGREGFYTMEDALCAGLMADILSARAETALTDLAWTLREQYRAYRDDLRVPLSHGLHYNFIWNRGLHDDIDYCLRQDISTVVPYVNGEGEIVL